MRDQLNEKSNENKDSTRSLENINFKYELKVNEFKVIQSKLNNATEECLNLKNEVFEYLTY